MKNLQRKINKNGKEVEVMMMDAKSGECRIIFWPKTSNGMISKIKKVKESMEYFDGDIHYEIRVFDEDDYDESEDVSFEDMKSYIRKLYKEVV